MTTITLLLRLLDARQRRQLLMIAPTLLGMALAEVASLVAVSTLFALFANPQVFDTDRRFSWLPVVFSFAPGDSFVFAAGTTLVVVAVSMNLVLIIGNVVLFRYGSAAYHRLASRLLEGYVRQPASFFHQHDTTSLSNDLLLQVQQVVEGAVLPGLLLVARACATAGLVAVLVAFDPTIALVVTMFIGCVYGVIDLATRRYLRSVGPERVRANKERHRVALDVLSGIKELRILGRERSMQARFERPSSTFARLEGNVRIIGSVPRYLIESAAMVSVAGAVLLLSARGNSIAEALPALGLYAFAGYRLIPSFQQMFAALSQLRYARASVEAVRDLIDSAPGGTIDVDGEAEVGDVTPLPFEKVVRFERVTFGYGRGPLVLDALNLVVPKGSFLALVGESGAGKSTVADILLGVASPTSGRVWVDDVPLEGRTIRRWQKRLGYVPQTIFFANDTVARNVALGVDDEDIDMDAVRRATARARLDGFVERELPDGYATVIGEGGSRLSGGQRQRLGLARALYRDPTVIVLDEATSALDGRTESSIVDALHDAVNRDAVTVVAIAHRIETIRRADTVAVLEGGTIGATGTFDEVLKASETFRALTRGRSEEAIGPRGPSESGRTADR